ncbi:MAG: SUMF1/EgtB/PvdO family nonheme iron enzyme [Kiritimatiellae bacterium]|nr:SUMF1/EgtB/PvdO family nonheme iron enzyme [Kiritimatiellia bacterium]
MKAILQSATVLLLAVTASAADPTVSNVLVSQGADRRVTVSYDLSGAPAIVTFEVFTNGVSIGGRALWASYGDVNVKVPPGNRAIFWQPREWNDRFVDDGSVSVKVTAHALDNPPDYMAVDLGMPSNCVWYANAEAVPFGVTNDVYKTEKLLMRRIHAAGVRWRKGSSQGQDTGHWGTEPAYPVILTQDYYIGVFQVTYRQCALFSNPGANNTSYALYPQQNVNSDNLRGTLPDYDWYLEGSKVNQNLPIGKLRNYTGIKTFDLPTDAQWEFACLGGTAHPRFGVLAADLPKYAWHASSDYTMYGATGSKSVQHVGLLLPNPYGLYDMLGNGSELCNDWYGEGDDYAVEGVLQVDPRGPASHASNWHVVHAASWDHGADNQRACARKSGLTIGQSASSIYATCRLICGIDMR